MRNPQEDLLVIEALVEYHHDRKAIQPERAARAWVLAEEIAASHGLEVVDALAQRTKLE
ncbi:hypothetical protein [Haloterrigena turkmenica]|nr:hypothetical protein [Haloterrigena turkmenica]